MARQPCETPATLVSPLDSAPHPSAVWIPPGAQLRLDKQRVCELGIGANRTRSGLVLALAVGLKPRGKIKESSGAQVSSPLPHPGLCSGAGQAVPGQQPWLALRWGGPGAGSGCAWVPCPLPCGAGSLGPSTPCSWDRPRTLHQDTAVFHPQLQHSPWACLAALMPLSQTSSSLWGAAPHPRHHLPCAVQAAASTAAPPAGPRVATANLCPGCWGHICSASTAGEISALGRAGGGKGNPWLPAGEERGSGRPGSPAGCIPSNSQCKSACSQLTPCRTSSGPHSILQSQAAAGLCCTDGTQEHPARRQGTPTALSGHHLLLAGEDGGSADQVLCRLPHTLPAQPHSLELTRAPWGTPAPPAAWHQGNWGRGLERVQMQPQGGSYKLLEFGNCCSLWEFARPGEEPQGSARAAGSSVLPLKWGNRRSSMGGNPSPGQPAGSHPKSAQTGHTGLAEGPAERLSGG